MAEERLIDTDKDKKYRFRINEDGEEELIIDDGLTEEADSPAEEVNFEVPEFTDDDEEAAIMTPEQLAEKQRRAEQEKLERERKLASLIAEAENDVKVGNYATALEALAAAQELSPENGEVCALTLLVYTRNFTTYDESAEKAAEAAEGVAKYASAERKAELLSVAEHGLKAEISALTEKVAALSAENEQKKAERAVRFNADNKKALTRFACVAAPFAAFLALAVYFSTVMFARQDGVNIALTAVFAALAFITFILLIFTARSLNTAARRVRLNKNDSKTKLGREYLASKKRLGQLNAIYSALKDSNDIS